MPALLQDMVTATSAMSTTKIEKTRPSIELSAETLNTVMKDAMLQLFNYMVSVLPRAKTILSARVELLPAHIPVDREAVTAASEAAMLEDVVSAHATHGVACVAAKEEPASDLGDGTPCS